MQRFPAARISRNSISARGFNKSFSAAAAPSTVSYNRKGEQPSVAPLAVKTLSKTSSGVSVASIDHHGPAAAVAVVVKAGSRFDAADKPGVAHLLKRAVFRNPENDSLVRTVLDAELRGNALYSSVDREHIVVGGEFLRDDVVDVVPTLVSNLFNPSFQVYELLEALDATAEQSQAALSDPATAVSEKLHQVAFRTGLGNPLFASVEALEGLNRADLKERVSQLFTADRISVVAAGVEHGELKKIVEDSIKKVKIAPSSSVVAPKSVYYGGEARIEGGPQSTAIYAVAYPGASYTSSEYPASLVLKALLGGSQRVKWASPSARAGLLGDAATESTSSVAFSHSYSDSGLVGFVVEGETASVKDVVKMSIATLKGLSSKVSSEALEAAKKTAIIDAEASLNRHGLLDALSRESTGGVAALSDVSAISAVTAADIQKLAKAAIAAKPSIVAYGNLLALPYGSDL